MRSSSQSLKEYGRGIIGGLIFSLPIIYTMEMWWAGFTLPPEKLLLNVVVTYLLLLGYNNFCGIHHDHTFWDVCRESVEEIGIAFLATFLFLWLIGRLDLSMSISEMAGKTIVETMIVAIGISVGTEQLGTGEGMIKAVQRLSIPANHIRTGNLLRCWFYPYVVRSFLSLR